MRMIVIAALCVLASPQAVAQSDSYPWCAEYGENGPGTNCGFVTFDQCQATVSGIGGFCRRNLFYTGSANGAERRSAKTRR
jgi:hypothetical protein